MSKWGYLGTTVIAAMVMVGCSKSDVGTTSGAAGTSGRRRSTVKKASSRDRAREIQKQLGAN